LEITFALQYSCSEQIMVHAWMPSEVALGFISSKGNMKVLTYEFSFL